MGRQGLGYVGGVRRVDLEFYDDADVLADPTTIVVEFTEPTQSEVQLTWPAVSSPPVVKDAVGRFHFDWPMAREGTHTYKYRGTGAVAAAAAGQFVVADTPQD
jgi:ABC-type transport system substrate-binding protein